MNTPTQLQGWATRWALSPEGLADLLATMGAAVTPPPPLSGTQTSEGYVQSLVRLEAPKYGVYLTRNNVGALLDKRGVPVRFGLANESPAQNKAIKSGDLIGIDGRPIEQWEVGRPRGRLVSRECKKVGWTYSGDEHEQAQLNWATLVKRYGGDAKFVSGEGSFE